MLNVFDLYWKFLNIKKVTTYTFSILQKSFHNKL